LSFQLIYRNDGKFSPGAASYHLFIDQRPVSTYRGAPSSTQQAIIDALGAGHDVVVLPEIGRLAAAVTTGNRAVGRDDGFDTSKTDGAHHREFLLDNTADGIGSRKGIRARGE